jgi:predicted nuclease of predicted toxin-antitoxin system
VKFLVDAQLPRRLALWLQQRGHDVVHTLDLAQQNRTPDPLLLARANQDVRVLVTKDTDFEITHELGQGPPKLLLITTGNIHNNELLSLFVRHEETLFRLLAQHEFIELSRSQVIVHR